ncbi:23424_t:CDS:2 [Gigaspora rosea]|nr:23424_t:CDS:2 [Gigaspora rosea]
MPLWAIGEYPVGREDTEIEMVLYVLRRSVDRDPESQAIFRRGEYYSVGGKIVPSQYAGDTRPKMSVATSTHMTITNNSSESNKCPLKVSFVGTPQEKLTVIENTKNSIIEMLITNYTSQDYSYTINVVILHTNPQFEHLKTATHLQESIIFVHSQILTTPINSTHSKLLNIHQNISKNLKSMPSTDSSNIEYEPSSKHQKLKETDKSIENPSEMENAETIDVEFTNATGSETKEANFVKSKKTSKNNKTQKYNTQNQRKGKERPVRTTRGAKPLHELNQDTVYSDKE